MLYGYLLMGSNPEQIPHLHVWYTIYDNDYHEKLWLDKF